MEYSVSQKIIRNTKWNILARLFRILTFLFLIPFIIHHVGTTRYGIWVTLFAFVEYFTFLDFGFGAATIKYSADYYARKDFLNIGRIVSATVLFHSLIIIPVVCLLFFTGPILCVFHVTPQYTAESLFVLRAILVIFAFNHVTSVFRNILIGLQRMDVQNACVIIHTLLYVIGTVAVLEAGFGLKGMVLLIGGLRFFLSLSQGMLVFNIVPEIRAGIKRLDSRIFKEFFHYGIRLQFTSFAGFLNLYLDKILIGHFLRIDLVTFYELGAKIAMLIQILPSFFSAPLIPASAELAATNDKNRLIAIHLKGSRYITLIAAPVSSFMIVMAPVIMGVWMGSMEYLNANLTLRILSVGYFFGIITLVVRAMGRGIGKLQYEMHATAIIAVANLALSITLILTIGFSGALVGTSLAMTMGNILLLYRFNRYIGVPFLEFVKRSVAKPILCAAVAGAATCWLQVLLSNTYLILSPVRLHLLLTLMITGAVFSAIYGISLVLTSAVGRSDLKLMVRLITSKSPAA
ncbi:MAG: oligosaccharide flippase family protein [Desulfobacterales bacterium]